MTNKYLLEQGRKIENEHELQEGHLYLAILGGGEYNGFVMPSENRISRNGCTRLVEFAVWHVPEKGQAGRIKFETIILDDFAFNSDILGVVEPREDSDVRMDVEKGLGIRRRDLVA